MADSAEKALALIQESRQEGNPVRIAVLDYNMPDMDGVELADIIKNNESFKDTKLILLASGLIQGSMDNRKKELFNSIMTKPVKPTRLKKVIEKLLRVTRDEDEFSKLEYLDDEIQVILPLDILLVEDHVINCKVATLELKRLGCSVDIAENGQDAVDMFGKKTYDIILMDVNMPVMDGFEATGSIRDIERQTNKKPVPIIAMTANAMRGDKERCINAGMDDYISKPMQRNILRQKLEQWSDKRSIVRKNEMSDDGDSVEDLNQKSLENEHTPPEKDIKKTEEWKEDKTIFNFDDAIERYDGNLELLKELVEEFLSDCDVRIFEMAKKLGEGDFASIRNNAHGMKGGASYISFERFVKAAFQLEVAGGEGDNEKIALSLNKLKGEYSTVKKYMNLFRWPEE